MIIIASEDNKFYDYNEIKNVAKHEFGHALGLGDLYASEPDGLDGVDQGTYYELDGYYISNKNYAVFFCNAFCFGHSFEFFFITMKMIKRSKEQSDIKGLVVKKTKVASVTLPGFYVFVFGT